MHLQNLKCCAGLTTYAGYLKSPWPLHGAPRVLAGVFQKFSFRVTTTDPHQSRLICLKWEKNENIGISAHLCP